MEGYWDCQRRHHEVPGDDQGSEEGRQPRWDRGGVGTFSVLVLFSGFGTWLLLWNEDMIEAAVYHHQIQV